MADPWSIHARLTCCVFFVCLLWFFVCLFSGFLSARDDPIGPCKGPPTVRPLLVHLFNKMAEFTTASINGQHAAYNSVLIDLPKAKRRWTEKCQTHAGEPGVCRTFFRRFRLNCSGLSFPFKTRNRIIHSQNDTVSKVRSMFFLSSGLAAIAQRHGPLQEKQNKLHSGATLTPRR